MVIWSTGVGARDVTKALKLKKTPQGRIIVDDHLRFEKKKRTTEKIKRKKLKSKKTPQGRIIVNDHLRFETKKRTTEKQKNRNRKA